MTIPVEQIARELLASEYERAVPNSEMAKLVRSGAKLNERGPAAAALRAIITALNTDEERIRRDERDRIGAWLRAKDTVASTDVMAFCIETGEHEIEMISTPLSEELPGG